MESELQKFKCLPQKLEMKSTLWKFKCHRKQEIKLFSRRFLRSTKNTAEQKGHDQGSGLSCFECSEGVFRHGLRLHEKQQEQEQQRRRRRRRRRMRRRKGKEG